MGAVSLPGSVMSVLVVAHRFSLGFGGVPESILLLARELGEYGIRLDVFSRDGFACDVGELSDLPSAGQPRQRAGMPDVAGYGCVFVAGAWNPAAWWIAMQARRNGVRLVYTPKGNLARAEFRRWRDLKKFPYLATIELSLLAICDRIVFSSELEQNRSVLLFRRKSVVIPEPFRGPPLEPAVGARSGTPVRFGFMAEIAPRKGLADFVSAFIAWQRRGNLEAELHIAGQPRPGSENYYEKVQAMAATAPRPDMIRFLGPLRGNRREDFYESIDFFVCPTKFESFGLTPLEALWHGKPVMVTESLGVLEFISDPHSIISLGRGSLDEILDALEAAMVRRECYMRAASAWRMRRNLSADRIALRFAHEFGFRHVVAENLRSPE